MVKIKSHKQNIEFFNDTHDLLHNKICIINKARVFFMIERWDDYKKNFIKWSFLDEEFIQYQDTYHLIQNETNGLSFRAN
jgi:hypothetical protein